MTSENFDSAVADAGAHAIADLGRAFDAMRRASRTGVGPNAPQRRDHLRCLIDMLRKNRQSIRDALRADFTVHSDATADLIEIAGVIGRAEDAIAKLDEWMAPDERYADPAMFGTGRAYVEYQPKGVIGLMVPWNFPIELSCGPLTDMLAAGNRVLIKPSELAPASSRLLRDMIGRSFEPDHVAVAEGGVELARGFTALPWDHLLYTGSTRVGREVLRAAAENLVPVTLELGGKCPAILTRSGVTAEAIASVVGMKSMKSGQVCVSVDHVFVPASEVDHFVELVETHVRTNMPGYFASEHATGLIAGNHFDRVMSLIEDARAAGARIISLGLAEEVDRPSSRIPLHLVVNPPAGTRVMKEEVFGPVLPVLTFEALEEPIAMINAGERPLGIYVYGDDDAELDAVVRATTSGGVTINGAALHGALSTLGFGGIGASGMGRHHGRDGFREFSNQRSIFVRGEGDLTAALFPPFGEMATAIADAVIGSVTPE